MIEIYYEKNKETTNFKGGDYAQKCMNNSISLFFEDDDEQNQLFALGFTELVRAFLIRPQHKPFFERFVKKYKSKELLESDEAKNYIKKYKPEISSILEIVAPTVLVHNMLLDDALYLENICLTFHHLYLSDIGYERNHFYKRPYLVNDPIICHKMLDDLHKLVPILKDMRKNDVRDYMGKMKQTYPSYSFRQPIDEKKDTRLIISITRDETIIQKCTTQLFSELDQYDTKESTSDMDIDEYLDHIIPFKQYDIDPVLQRRLQSIHETSVFLAFMYLLFENDMRIKYVYVVGEKFRRELPIASNIIKNSILYLYDKALNQEHPANAKNGVYENVLIQEVAYDSTYNVNNALSPCHDFSTQKRLYESHINTKNYQNEDILYMANQILTMDIIPKNAMDVSGYMFEWVRRLHVDLHEIVRKIKNNPHLYHLYAVIQMIDNLYIYRQNDLRLLWQNVTERDIQYTRESLLTIYCSDDLASYPKQVRALREQFDEIYHSHVGPMFNYVILMQHLVLTYLQDKKYTIMESSVNEQTINDLKNKINEQTTAHEQQVKQIVKTYEQEKKQIEKRHRTEMKEHMKKQEIAYKETKQKDATIRKLEKEIEQLKNQLQEQMAINEHPSVNELSESERVYRTPGGHTYTENDLQALSERLNQPTVFFYGGHDKWVQRIQEMFPRATVKNPDQLNTNLESLVEKHTTIIINTHVMNHSGSLRVKEHHRKRKQNGEKRDLIFIDSKAIRKENLLIALFDTSVTQSDWFTVN